MGADYPTSVVVDGCRYRLNLDFRRVLAAFNAQRDAGLLDGDKVTAQARLLIRRRLRGKDAARVLEAVYDLFPKNKDGGERALDFEQDWPLIRGAFLVMGHDLSRERMHFFKFLDLLQNAPRDTALMRTVELRLRPIPEANKHNQRQIAELQKAKARVALTMSADEARERFAAQLKNINIGSW